MKENIRIITSGYFTCVMQITLYKTDGSTSRFSILASVFDKQKYGNMSSTNYYYTLRKVLVLENCNQL